MVTTLKTDNGYVYAYCEWRILNKYGYEFSPRNYIFIKELWIHPKYRNLRTIRRMIAWIDRNELTKNVPYVYWHSEKYEKQKVYDKNKLLKKGVLNVR